MTNNMSGIMIQVTDKNREKILDQYAESVLDGMDFQSLWELAYNHIRDSKDLMENEALENEILELYPEILEN
jgi:hypothetical protein